MLDRIFGWLMVAAALLHSFGAWTAYRSQHEMLLWALTAGLAELYLAGMNLIRAERRHDLVLARLCVFGNLSWLLVVVCFAGLIGHFFERRVLIQFVITTVLLGMSLRARNRSRPM
ncbi:hypothetical protein [Terriglobus roseus]|nr:hypothetical protein [Terriglobus roseus]